MIHSKEGRKEVQQIKKLTGQKNHKYLHSRLKPKYISSQLNINGQTALEKTQNVRKGSKKQKQHNYMLS